MQYDIYFFLKRPVIFCWKSCVFNDHDCILSNGLESLEPQCKGAPRPFRSQGYKRSIQAPGPRGPFGAPWGPGPLALGNPGIPSVTPLLERSPSIRFQTQPGVGTPVPMTSKRYQLVIGHCRTSHYPIAESGHFFPRVFFFFSWKL